MKKLTNKILAVLALGLFVSTSSFAQKEGNGKRPEGPPSIKQILKDLDTDKDGKISLKEAKGPLKKDFKKIDTNNDGFISKKEIKNAPKPEKRERPRN
ncbi:EF-hand domain-containing protein [Polaribacter sp. MSW13]|uniref:EF-hand domain-containing protein n=1 Tax=Polaribacter marinus TaxID=2916838 RepID=A0A9X1VNS1_9FLAO|nr:EF-hand domain-containing protein [Polaribacter marinus]MCI2227830.1 EF-hand domain-containing protein [Polaribacter marinus]